MSRVRRIFISVAEDSADVYAAALVRAARAHLPECSFYGLTGPRMRAEGVETVYDLTAHAAMLAGVLKVIGRAWRAVGAVTRSWRENRPDLVVLLDSPTLHMPLAKRARAAGIPVLYYIAPQTWASRERRNRRIARDVDRLACILPFEPEYFHKQGVPQAEYVGHPLFETLAGEKPDAATVERLRTGAGPLIAVLPGSRRHVIETMLPLQLRVLGRLQSEGVAVRAAISAVAEDRCDLIHAALAREGIDADLVIADNAGLLTAADLVLVASGTATLQVAHYRKPMIVMYDAGRLLRLPHRLFGRFMLKTPHLSLVNILAGSRVVPEFMPFVRDTDEIARVAGQLLSDESWRRLMISQIETVIAPLEGSHAGMRMTEMMQALLDGSARGRD